MLGNICMKFHEGIMNGFGVTERTRPYRKILLFSISEGHNSKNMQSRVTVLTLCTSSHVALHLYKVSWKYLKRFSSYRLDTILWRMDNPKGGDITIEISKHAYICGRCLFPTFYLMTNNIFECFQLAHFTTQNLKIRWAMLLLWGIDSFEAFALCLSRYRTYTVNMLAYILPAIKTSKHILQGLAPIQARQGDSTTVSFWLGKYWSYFGHKIKRPALLQWYWDKKIVLSLPMSSDYS